MDVAGARNPSQIVEFYKGKTIFLTGVTGFLGKILLAQLFQHCPGVKKVICLIRGRQGVSASARFEKEVFGLELFANLIKNDPSIKDKVHVRNFDYPLPLHNHIPSSSNPAIVVQTYISDPFFSECVLIWRCMSLRSSKEISR